MNTLRTTNEILESGDWSTDNQMGRELAAAYVSSARASGSPLGINAVIQEMTAAQRFGGVEVGFVSALAAEIIRPSF